MMINQGYANGVRYFSKNIIKRFTEKSETILNSDYVLGWDTPSQNGKVLLEIIFLNLLMDIWVLLVHQCG